MSKPKELVKLRQKPLRGGGASLYLDVYQNGRRTYEFLRLYLIPEKSTLDKVQNKETLRTAQAIKAQRIIELQNNSYGLPTTSKGRVKLSDYAAAHSKASVWPWVVKLLAEYAPTLTIGAVTKSHVEGFINFLENKTSKRNGAPLSPNTIKTLFSKLCCLLNKAEREGILPKNPAKKLASEERPHNEAAQREYLTADEVAAIIAAPHKRTDIKQAFLFCCFCGLRFSDMIKLKWGDIKTLSDGTKQAEIKQQKTKQPLYLPLSGNAVKWLPDRPTGANDEACIFPQFRADSYNRLLKKLIQAANIKKVVTWHVSRHTFATLLLTYGADIYTTSKLLGHSNVTTTQIYAKVIDANKRAAVELIPRL